MVGDLLMEVQLKKYSITTNIHVHVQLALSLLEQKRRLRNNTFKAAHSNSL